MIDEFKYSEVKTGMLRKVPNGLCVTSRSEVGHTCEGVLNSPKSFTGGKDTNESREIMCFLLCHVFASCHQPDDHPRKVAHRIDSSGGKWDLSFLYVCKVFT
jgi:hypothetical protein